MNAFEFEIFGLGSQFQTSGTSTADPCPAEAGRVWISSDIAISGPFGMPSSFATCLQHTSRSDTHGSVRVVSLSSGKPEILVSSEHQSQVRQDKRSVEDLRCHGRVDDDRSSHGLTPLISPTGVDNPRWPLVAQSEPSSGHDTLSLGQFASADAVNRINTWLKSSERSIPLSSIISYKDGHCIQPAGTTWNKASESTTVEYEDSGPVETVVT